MGAISGKRHLEYKRNETGKLVCNDVMAYDDLRNVMVTVFEFSEKTSIFFTVSKGMLNSSGYAERKTCWNVFGGQVLYEKYGEVNSSPYLNVVEETDLVSYLVIYDKIQLEYTEQDLKDILERIKIDYEAQKQKDKQLVIEN